MYHPRCPCIAVRVAEETGASSDVTRAFTSLQVSGSQALGQVLVPGPGLPGHSVLVALKGFPGLCLAAPWPPEAHALRPQMLGICLVVSVEWGAGSEFSCYQERL